MWILSALVFVLNAAEASNSNLVEGARSQVLKNEVIQFKPLAGHHFSSEAPQKCGQAVMVEKSVREVACQFSTPGETKVLLNVCDDKKTFCKPTELKVAVSESSSKQKLLTPLKQTELVKLRKELVPGFIEGSVGSVREMALKLKKPVFVMISTEWCPPCNETKEFLFNTEAFKNASQDWLKVYVDGDSLQAAEWEKVVPYRVFPTMALLNSQMQEVGRFTKELRSEEFKNWAAQQSQFMARASMPTLAAQFKSGATQLSKDDSLKLMDWAIDAGDETLLKDLRKKVSNLSPELEIKLINHDFKEMDEKSKKQTLVKLLKMTEQKDDFEDYLAQYCSLDAKACKAFLPKLEKRFSTMENWKGLTPAEKASTIGEAAFAQSEIYLEMGDSSKAKAAAERCVVEFDKQMKLSRLKISRSANQAKTHCLDVAGKNEEAEKLTEQLMVAYPNESTFLIRMAKLKRKEKNYKAALEWTSKAEKLAYGYNWYSAMVLKAQIEMDQKDKKAALSTLEGALAQLSLPQEKELRNHLILSRIRNLQASAEKM